MLVRNWSIDVWSVRFLPRSEQNSAFLRNLARDAVVRDLQGTIQQTSGGTTLNEAAQEDYLIVQALEVRRRLMMFSTMMYVFKLFIAIVGSYLHDDVRLEG